MTYISECNCVLSSIKLDTHKEIEPEQHKHIISNLKPMENYVSINLFDFVETLKVFRRLNYSTLKFSFDTEFKLNLSSCDELKVTEINRILPFIEPNNIIDFKDKFFKLSVNILYDQFKHYKKKDLKKEIKIKFVDFAEHPVYFKVNTEHDFFISPIVDND